jgi:collagenase-like PrtC family protease
MMTFAAGYQHFAYGPSFADIALSHPSVKEVYFPWIDEPSGRPMLGYDEENDSDILAIALHRDLLRLREKGIKLDLLLNANCYGAEAMSRKLETHVIEVVETLAETGLKPEIVTAASPFIARTVKKAFPDIEVRASVNMRLATLQAVQYLSPWFDSYYIGRDVQRNLGTVERFSKWCRENGKKLCMLANSGCLRNCPWQTYHDNLISHSADADRLPAAKDFNPHLCWTMYKDPVNFPEFLKSTWVRPEDIRRYEGLVDIVKLATRQHANPDMVISAYERGSYYGNLLDLFEPGFSPAFFPRYVENSAFPGDWFDRTSVCARECTGCGYCEEVFGKVCRTVALVSGTPCSR